MNVNTKAWRRIWLISAIAAAGLAAWHWRANLLLAWNVRAVAREFPVAGLGADSLSRLIENDPDGLLILDTRSPAEYAVSRIAGAEKVDWRLDCDSFRRQFGRAVEGRKVVFYCSIGYRSSALLQRVDSCLLDSGAQWGANLTGGIFGWYNAGRIVVDPSGAPTDTIHPYDKNWGRLVKLR